MKDLEKTITEPISELKELQRAYNLLRESHDTEIAEQNKVVDDLTKSEKCLKTIIESTSDFIWTVDPLNFGIQTYNLALYNYFLKNRGLKLEIGDTPDILVPTREDVWIGFYKKALKFGVYETEYDVVAGTHVLYLIINRIVRENKVISISVFGTNITKLKQFEKELIASKEKLEEANSKLNGILENLQDAYFQADLSGNFTFINPAAIKMYGYSNTEEMVGLPAMTLYADKEARNTLLTELHKSGKATDWVTRGLRKNGMSFWVSMNVQFLYDKQGRIIGTEGVIRDISDRKLAEEKLKESESRIQKKLNSLLSADTDLGELELADIIDTDAIETMMRDFYNFSKVPIAIIDLQGKVLVGPGWQDICTKFHRVHPETLRNCIEGDTLLSKNTPPGVFNSYLCKNSLWDNSTPLIVGGKHVGYLFTGQYFYEGEKPDDQVFRDQAAKYGFDEKEYLDAVNKVPIWSREHIQNILNFCLKLANMISSLSHANFAMAKSLESLKQKENALEQSKDYLDKIINTVGSPIFVKDERHIYYLVNDAFCSLLKLPIEKIIGTTGDEYYPEEELKVFLDIDLEVFNTGKENINEEFLTDGDGILRTFITLKTLYVDKTGNKFLVGVMSDITDLKHFEEELIKAKNRAEESDRLKSAFLANMSHEIRTPMNGILGFTGLLKRSDLTGDQQKNYMKIIEKSGARMLNIISEIMDISKIESGQMEVHLKETNIIKESEHIFNLLKPEAESKSLRFSMRSNLSFEEALIKTDKEKLYSILTNLIKNAIKYTDKGSIEFGYYKREKSLEFYVKDTGIGISKDRLKAIFERFVQADIEDVEARQGAGLGLSISKAFVEMLGGEIWLESKPGVGSSFYFNLPYHVESK